MKNRAHGVLGAWLVGSAGIVTAGVMVAFFAVPGGGVVASASAHSGRGPAARPRAAVQATGQAVTASSAKYPVEPFVQEFSTNTEYFCPAGSGNAPCDGNGAANDYGTIDRVQSGFSNGGYGNYAPSTTALAGHWMAIVSGTGDGNQGAGCPGTTATSNPGESCTGPYALFGTGKSEGAENVFPQEGFTVTDDLYLSPSTIPASGVGALVDDDVEINNASGGYGIDNIITACAESDASSASGMGLYISFGHGSPGSCSTSGPVVTRDGWYRFVFVFSDISGDAYLSEFVRSEPSDSLVASSGQQAVGGGTAESISSWGGPGYFWLPSEDFSGLPLANFALQLGQRSAGYTPWS